jgi:hypothetical protein
MMRFKEWQEITNIVELITNDFSLNEANWPQQWADEVIAKPDFQRWLHSVGVTEPLSTPREGGVGRAYFSGNFVVKFTTDRKEAASAAVVKGYDSPNLSKVSDVKMVSVNVDTFGQRKPLYAIVQQKVNTDVSKRHRIAGQAIYSYLDYNPGFIRSNVDEILHIVLGYLPKKYQNDRATAQLVYQYLTSMKKIQDDTGFLTKDTHGANIGLKGRNPAFFDLGRSSIDFDHPATANARIGKVA